MSERMHKMTVTSEERGWIKAWRAARVCASKQRFGTRTAAIHAAVHRKFRFTKPAPILHAYLCPECRGWHLTKKPQVKRSDLGNDSGESLPVGG